MGELRDLVLRDYTINGRRSGARARAALDHLAIHFDAVSPRRIHDQAADYVLTRSGEGAAPATIRYELAMLRRGMNLAFRSGRIDRRPYVPAIRVSNARSGFFEPDQVELVIAHLPDPIDDMARFGAVTGWRISEIMGLTWDDVDRGDGVVRIAPGSSKNGEPRLFPYGEHPELAQLMAWRWAHRAGPHVFHRSGRRVRYIRRAWNGACDRAGVGGRLFHDLRRSAVRNMERAGVPRSVQMKLVGLKTESIHRRYAITNEEDLARGVRLLTEAAHSR
jgi:integrase